MHYALNPGSLLILGTAESVGGFDHLFSPLDKKWKVFQRREVSEPPRLEIPARVLAHDRAAAVEPEKPGGAEMDITYAAQRALLDCYGPPSVVINVEGDILYVNGRTGKYLEPSSGKVNNNVFAMAREGLREELATAIHNAVTRKMTITADGLKVRSNGGSTTVNLTVKPLADPATRRGMLLVVFEETTAQAAETAAENGPKLSAPAAPPSQLEDELHRARERLQATVEEMEATQEELRSANEELQSNNEELQSTNEELNSSKEELQSLNEELQNGQRRVAEEDRGTVAIEQRHEESVERRAAHRLGQPFLLPDIRRAAFGDGRPPALRDRPAAMGHPRPAATPGGHPFPGRPLGELPGGTRFPYGGAQGTLAQCPPSRAGGPSRRSDPAGDGRHYRAMTCYYADNNVDQV
jgi:PAS domain-containing protein